MKRRFSTLIVLAIASSLAFAQGTPADYERASTLRQRLTGLTINQPERANWMGESHKFWYRKSVRGGHEFVIVDADAKSKAPAFDHARLAEALTKTVGETVSRLNLNLTDLDSTRSGELQFVRGTQRWKLNLSDYSLETLADRPANPNRGQGRGGGGISLTTGLPGPSYGSSTTGESRPSPNGKLEAFVQNFNIYVRPRGTSNGEATALSSNGTQSDYYALGSAVWSPDSRKLAVYRVKAGFDRKIQYVQSSPPNGTNPLYFSMPYAKPGDDLNIPRPVLFDIETKNQIEIENSLFANPYDLDRMEWRRDGRAFTFGYNQRGHQVYRVIEVDASTGQARAIISEEPKSFFCYSSKLFRRDIDDGKEIIWMSERDGWNHLYLIDVSTGAVKNQITKGEWVVRSVDSVDLERRQIWFQASGIVKGMDPYFLHTCRVNFDGNDLRVFTGSDGNHSTVFSSDKAYYVDTFSRVDLAPVTQLRKSDDPKFVLELERTDTSDLEKAGWTKPEVFTSIARDGKTDIWGVIIRPSNFNPKKRYPVIENIYAGPHSSFVPKSFLGYTGMQSLAELGFIVVQIDGMGTSNRSKAFHDVCWKNLGDAGFPDRVLWHKAVAAKYKWYDATRVGLYGTSAGGQSAMGGLLFQPDFYDVAVAACGCHDNRMDKIWWNEQWMGYPLDESYAASSNVDQAHRLKGKLLLIVGEMDTNVDPASTMQVVNGLVRANKDFDLLVLPNANHTSGGVYGERRRNDFFVRHLLGVEPPDWNREK